MIAVLTDLVGAVVLVVRLAGLAFETGPDLSTDTDAIADLYRFDPVTDFDGFTDDLVANTQGHWGTAPASIDGVDIGTTDTAAFNLNVDVSLLELLRFELDKTVSQEPASPTKNPTSCFLKFVQSSWDWTMNPSNVSG